MNGGNVIAVQPRQAPLQADHFRVFRQEALLQFLQLGLRLQHFRTQDGHLLRGCDRDFRIVRVGSNLGTRRSGRRRHVVGQHRFLVSHLGVAVFRLGVGQGFANRLEPPENDIGVLVLMSQQIELALHSCERLDARGDGRFHL